MRRDLARQRADEETGDDEGDLIIAQPCPHSARSEGRRRCSELMRGDDPAKHDPGLFCPEHFAASLFGVPPSAIQIGHLKQEALWSVEADSSAKLSVAATTEYGTTRANGVWLFEQALNLKTPVIYDITVTDGKEERTVNQDATLSAREKHKLIKEHGNCASSAGKPEELGEVGQMPARAFALDFERAFAGIAA